MHRRILSSALLAALAVAGSVACRQDEPAGDPKTPADLPLPSPDKEDDGKSGSPKLPLIADAG